MSTPYLLDTNTVSYIVSGISISARAHLAHLEGKNPVYVSAITEAELRFGMAKGAKYPLRIAMMERFLTKASVLPWTSREAAVYGRLRGQLEAAGSPLGALDTLIAAHAMALGAVLVSHDKAFQAIRRLSSLRGLSVIDWADDV